MGRFYCFARRLVAVLVCGLALGTSVGDVYANPAPGAVEIPAPPPPAVNKKLGAYLDGFATPKLVRLSERVYLAFAYDYANFTFIIGDDGVMAVDCGWWPDGMTRALKDLKAVTELPVTHVLITHSHADHVGGCSAIPGIDRIPVIASDMLEPARLGVVSPAFRFMGRRAIDQLGFLLAPGLEGDVGTGVGPRRTGGWPKHVPATRTVSDGESLTLSGVQIDIISAPSDVADAIAFWLPKEGVLLPGDVIGGIGPYIATPRYEETRDPEAFVATLDKLAKLPIKVLGPGHGRAYFGAEDIAASISNARDTTQFIIDHIVRGLNAGRTRQEILSSLKLPPHLANDPDLGFYYHPLDWVARGVYLRQAGWYGDDPAELFIDDPLERADKYVAAMGGAEAALQTAIEAARSGDWNWSGRLSALILRADPENQSARKLLINSMRAVAYDAESSSQRYYLLTGALELEGTLDRSKSPPLGDAPTLLISAPPMKSLTMLRPRLNVANSLETQERLIIAVPDEGTYALTINKGVLRVNEAPADNQEGPQLEMPKVLLPLLTMGLKSIDDVLSDERVEASDPKAIRLFFAHFE